MSYEKHIGEHITGETNVSRESSAKTNRASCYRGNI